MKSKFFLIGLGMILACYSASLTVFAAPMNEGKVLEVKGYAQYQTAGKGEWIKLEEGLLLHEGDKVKTAPNAEVKMELVGAARTAEIVIRKDTELLFETFRHDSASKEDNTMLNVDTGAVLVKAEKLIGESKFEVKTPTSIVGIRGTTFEVFASKN